MKGVASLVGIGVFGLGGLAAGGVALAAAWNLATACGAVLEPGCAATRGALSQAGLVALVCAAMTRLSLRGTRRH